MLGSCHGYGLDPLIDPAWEGEDYVGRAFLTVPITLEASSDFTTHISAHVIADEIVACRRRATSPSDPTLDYAAAWFGGPFRTWRQFNAFCDNLAAIGVLNDQRPLFDQKNPNLNVMPGWVDSPLMRRRAVQAIADVLKANFNPNLHLNEVNPDANLHTIVDKTDLIVNSTEFTFSPSGTYEIESLGRVLRPIDGGDAMTAADNAVMAECRVESVVTLFEQRRESTQKQFYAGSNGERASGSPATSNNRSVQTGPEPENGSSAALNEYEGYLTLSTIGGLGVDTPKSAVSATPFDAADACGSKMHAHFDRDDRAHHHVDGQTYCQNLARVTLAGEGVHNFPDPGESQPGPYMPAAAAGALSARALAHSFRCAPANPMPALTAHAPLDLRRDGVFLDRHAGVAYWLSQNALPHSTSTLEWTPPANWPLGPLDVPMLWPSGVTQQRVRVNGVSAFWVKPQFAPEMAGKLRTFFNMSQSPLCFTENHLPSAWWEQWPQPMLFNLVFAPAHDRIEFTPSIYEDYAGPQWWTHLAPASLLFAQSHKAAGTATLNHLGHTHSPQRPTTLREHAWMHVILKWNDEDGMRSRLEVYVNGELAGSTHDASALRSLGFEWPAFPDLSPKLADGWHTRAGGERNSIRLGSTSKAQSNLKTRYSNNLYNPASNASTNTGSEGDAGRGQHSADSTIDEFYFWGESGSAGAQVALTEALALWQKGRYHVPGNSDGSFTSQELTFSSTARALPPASSSGAPEGGTAGASIALASSAVTARILGASWTVYGEAVNADGDPIVYDYQDSTPAARDAAVTLTFLKNGATASALLANDAFSPVDSLDAGPADAVQYRLQFTIAGTDLNTILLASPALDDVTIFYTLGPRFLEKAIQP